MARVKTEDKVTVTIPAGYATHDLKVKNAPDGIVKTPTFPISDDSETFLTEALKLAGDDVKNLSRIFQRGLNSVLRTVSIVLSPEEKMVRMLVKNLGISEAEAKRKLSA